MVGWLELVGRARTPADLCALARYYVAELTPEELATIPEHCWPRVKAVDDLRYWHDRLADEFCRTAADPGPGKTHRELMAFFSAVIERLVALEVAQEDGVSNDGEDRALECRAARPPHRSG